MGQKHRGAPAPGRGQHQGQGEGAGPGRARSFRGAEHHGRVPGHGAPLAAEHEEEAQGAEGAEAAVRQYLAEAFARGAAALGVAHVGRAVPVQPESRPYGEKDPDPARKGGLCPEGGLAGASRRERGQDERRERPEYAKRKARRAEPGKRPLKARAPSARAWGGEAAQKGEGVRQPGEAGTGRGPAHKLRPPWVWPSWVWAKARA